MTDGAQQGMASFEGKRAVVTGGGSGMGRELVVQLAAEGCSVATCDVDPASLAETLELAQASATGGATVTTHVCDVSDEAQVLAFRDEVVAAHGDRLNLVCNNAGIGGGGSFINDTREAWERTFGVDWFGVYYCSRAFLPLLIAGDGGWLVNTSSVNGFYAALAPGVPHTAYSTAKFAVKGFSEALIEDLRQNAPHVRVAVVMPGHIGTGIVANSARYRGGEVDDTVKLFDQAFRDNAPLTAAQAATIILDGVREGRWRILVGEDAKILDERVRADPDAAYDPRSPGTIGSLIRRD